MNPYAKEYVDKLNDLGIEAKLYSDHRNIPKGDIAIFLSCEKIISRDTMKKSKHNLVVHESDLPEGKGWSPVTWQVLEGKNKIPICLFEAVEKVDSGVIYFKDFIDLDGSELIDEIRKKQAGKTFELLDKFLEVYPNVFGKIQKGKETFYKKRKPKDSELNLQKTIEEQFNLLRTVDNERYPAFVKYKGNKYVRKITKEE